MEDLTKKKKKKTHTMKGGSQFSMQKVAQKLSPQTLRSSVFLIRPPISYYGAYKELEYAVSQKT